MKIFISWSGEQSHALAKALHEWLPLVLHYVEPWLSQSDIEAGERWGLKIAKELETTNFGIICVTKENINAPWLLFEAGALAKSMEGGKVIPLLFDIDFKEVSGPLTQFQAKKVDKIGINNIISGINKVATNPVPDLRLNQLFGISWPSLETSINTIPKKNISSKHSRPESDILEELVSGVRGLEMRLRDNIDDNRWINKRRKGQFFHPALIRDMVHKITGNSKDPIGILLIVSLVREEIPWLYELGLELYKTSKQGEIKEIQIAYRRFINAIEVLYKSPLMEEFLDKQTYILLQEILPLLEFSIRENHRYRNETRMKSQL